MRTPRTIARCRVSSSGCGAGEVDAIAFTSTPQVERLFAVVDAARVKAALSRTVVAAVGPVVAETLEKHGISVRLMPSESFFLKPLTTVLEQALARAITDRPVRKLPAGPVQ